MIIPVTRFARHGVQIEDSTEIASDCVDRYADIRACGCRLTAEVLQTGHVSCCIEHPRLGDFDISVTANGPQVQVGIEKMLQRFTPEKFEEWKKEVA